MMKYLKSAEGWTSEQELACLFDLAEKAYGEGIIVEIGSWKGRSTIALALGSKRAKREKVFAVDPHKGEYTQGGRRTKREPSLYQFENNLKRAKVRENVFPIIKTSREASKIVKDPVRLLFIDGLHDYQSVRNDFLLWEPKVIQGGLIALHDVWCGYFGPNKLAKNLIFKSNDFSEYRVVGSTLICKKLKPRSVLVKFHDFRYKFIIPLAFNLNKIRFPKIIKYLLFQKLFYKLL